MNADIADTVAPVWAQFQKTNIANLLLCVDLDHHYGTELRIYVARLYGAAITFWEHREKIPENRSAEIAAEVYLEALGYFIIDIDKIKSRDSQKSEEYDALLALQFTLAEPYFREQNQRNHTNYPTTLEEFCQKGKK